MSKPSIFLEWLSKGLILLGLSSLICNHGRRCKQEMVDAEWLELYHHKVAGHLDLYLWLVLLQLIFFHYDFPGCWSLIDKQLIIV